MKDENSIDLVEVWQAVKKRKGIVIGIPLLITSIVLALSLYIMKPVYEATTSVIIGQNTEGKQAQLSSGVSSVLAYQSLTKTYANLITSRFIEEKALEKLQSNLAIDELNDLVTVDIKDETQLIEISVEGNTAKEALQRVNALTNAFLENVAKVYNVADVTIVDRGALPEKRVKPNKKLYTALGVFFGFLVSITVAVSLERRKKEPLNKVEKFSSKVEKLS